MIDLSGKVVLVTGASRGIGAAIARTLAGAGADQVLHYRTAPAEAGELREELGDGRCALVQADLARPGAAALLWRDAESWKGHIDCVVNNAGIMVPGGVDDDEAQWSAAWTETLQVNLIAAADICREAIRHFRIRGGGIIINMASRAAFRGDDPDYMHYAASKGGMIALTRTIARGFAGEGVLAYAVAPGFVATDMAREFVAAHGDAAILRDIPLGAMVPPAEVANIVAFLAAGLARHATGATFDINGASYVR